MKQRQKQKLYKVNTIVKIFSLKIEIYFPKDFPNGFIL